MPIVSMILGGLLSMIGTIVGKAIFSLGAGFVIYKGLYTLTSWIKDQILYSFDKMPIELVDLLGYMNVGQCINIIMSAMAVRMIINGLNSDSIRKFTWNK